MQALLASRIDRLAEHERAVAQRGSVEGRLFHRGAVTALLPEIERPEVGAHLLSLVRKELIRPDRATLPGDDGFRFGHILIRDAAYDAIPKRQRARLHEHFATWLEEGSAATHRTRSSATTSNRRIRTPPSSTRYRYRRSRGERLAAAARAATARQDIAAAVNLLRRAVELAGGGRSGAAHVRLGEALKEPTSRTSSGRVRKGVGLAREVGDEHAEWLGRVWLTLVQALQSPEGAIERMLEEAQAAVAAREAASDHEVLAVAWGRIAAAHAWRETPRSTCRPTSGRSRTPGGPASRRSRSALWQ